jgi:hypothetical protein
MESLLSYKGHAKKGCRNDGKEKAENKLRKEAGAGQTASFRIATAA